MATAPEPYHLGAGVYVCNDRGLIVLLTYEHESPFSNQRIVLDAQALNELVHWVDDIQFKHRGESVE